MCEEGADNIVTMRPEASLAAPYLTTPLCGYHLPQFGVEAGIEGTEA
jgi:hypothetical protein